MDENRSQIVKTHFIIACVSCDKMLSVVHEKGTCKLAGFRIYLMDDQRSQNNYRRSKSNLFSFGICSSCNRVHVERYQVQALVMMSVENTTSHSSYIKALTLCKGNLDIAIRACKTAFTKFENIADIFDNEYTLKSIVCSRSGFVNAKPYRNEFS